MRVIAGEFRGRKLLPPVGDTTRPITDRAKQSIFDVLSPRIESAAVYDCFAGTGSMGLECLSRGAGFVTFFEIDRAAISRLHGNIATLGVKDRSSVIAVDLFKWIKSTPPPPRQIDLIFLDPPYPFLKDHPEDLQRLANTLATQHLATHGLLIFRHDRRDEIDLPGLQAGDCRDYGNMRVEIMNARPG
ncbi:MAG: RsmD family RNA methyltransferase [Planctomycetota bacterium]|nr:RsmD family RNA methyltransferase [Planctomycetota bacterium]